jgi:outer membrane protein assembly factor BamB
MKAPRARTEPLDHRNGGSASPSPVADGERVWVFFGDYGLLGYSKDGEEMWRHPLGPFNNLYGMGASPILAAGKVVLAVDQQQNSFLLALDRDTGEVAWRTDRPQARSGHSTPILHHPEGGELQIVVPGSF